MSNELIWDLIEVGICFIEMIVTYLLFKNALGLKETLNKSTYFIWLTVIALFSSFIYIVNSSQVLTIFICLFTRLMYSFMFKGKIRFKILYTVLYIALTDISEIFTVYFLIIILNVSSQVLLINSPFRLVGIIISKILMLAFVKILAIILNLKNLNMAIQNWLILISVPLFSFSCIATLSLYNNKSYFTLKIISMTTTICIIYINVIVFFLFDSLIDYFNLKTNKKLLEQQSDYQLKFFQNTMSSDKALKSLKHDMKNHMLCLNELIRSRQFDDAEKYLNSITEVFKSSDKVIHTDNIVIDSILNAKFVIMKEKNIEFSYNIEIPPKIGMEPIDICVVFGNSMDNAIEACERITHGAKTISLAVIYKSNSLLISVKNTTDGKPVKRGATFLSSKRNLQESGIGLSNIKRVVEKYNGILDVKYNDNTFELSAVLYNI